MNEENKNEENLTQVEKLIRYFQNHKIFSLLIVIIIGIIGIGSFFGALNKITDFFDPYINNENQISITKYITEGNEFDVVLSECDIDDDGWQGSDDPLGTLKCGDTYTVSYKVQSKKFRDSGYHEYDKQVATHEYYQENPTTINMWGIPFSYNDGLKVYTEGYGHIGEIILPSK